MGNDEMMEIFDGGNMFDTYPFWKMFSGHDFLDGGGYPGFRRYCTSTLASWTLLMLVMKALIGNIHSSNHAHHPTHKTRQNPLPSSNTSSSRRGVLPGRTKTFNIISLELLLGQGGEYFTPFFSPFPRESEGERVRERE